MSAKSIKPVPRVEPLSDFIQEPKRPVVVRSPTPLEQMYAYFSF